MPTLIIHAEWDADLPSDQARGYFAKLTNTPYKRFVELGEGTHTVMMEKNRMQVFHEVMNFLAESDPQAFNQRSLRPPPGAPARRVKRSAAMGLAMIADGAVSRLRIGPARPHAKPAAFA